MIPEQERTSVVTPFWMIIYLVATMVVGTAAAVLIYRHDIGSHGLFWRLLPMLLVGELIIYLIMLIVPGERVVPPERAAFGVGFGLVIRASMAFLSASAIRLTDPSLGQALVMKDVYASYWLAALVQILLTVLYLWLIRGALESGRLKPPVQRAQAQARVQMQEEEQAGEERRRRLLSALVEQREADGGAAPVGPLPGAAHAIPPALEEPQRDLPFVVADEPTLAPAEEEQAPAPQEAAVVEEPLREEPVESVPYVTEEPRPRRDWRGLAAGRPAEAPPTEEEAPAPQEAAVAEEPLREEPVESAPYVTQAPEPQPEQPDDDRAGLDPWERLRKRVSTMQQPEEPAPEVAAEPEPEAEPVAEEPALVPEVEP
ncbi:MAG: hypothetical protein ABFD96_10980, partial [Armatimonadia bacterium]